MFLLRRKERRFGLGVQTTWTRLVTLFAHYIFVWNEEFPIYWVRVYFLFLKGVRGTQQDISLANFNKVLLFCAGKSSFNCPASQGTILQALLVKGQSQRLVLGGAQRFEQSLII